MRELERASLLLGKEAIETLQKKTVLVVGVGGVGGMCVEALARSGIGCLILVDKDTIEESNINRQLIANFDTLSHSKVEEWKKRIHLLSKRCKVIILHTFYDASLNETLDQYKIDYIIDAIDSISSKKDLIAYALDRHIPFLSSMGMARKKDISKLKVMEVEQTSYDPIAKQIRVWKRKQKIREKIMVVSSTEIPVSVESGQPLPSMIFVPAAAGLLLADACIRYLSSHPQ